jgi:hypothetical protein
MGLHQVQVPLLELIPLQNRRPQTHSHKSGHHQDQ